MTTPTIFILCQGEQRRLAHLGPKHLLEVGDEPILRRTLRLLRELGEQQPIVVGRGALHGEVRRDAEERGDSDDARLELDDPGTCVLDGIARLAPWWPNSTLILLGDVIWSRRALEWTLTAARKSRSICFAGTAELSRSGGEVYAVGWHANDHDAVRQLVATAPCRIRADGGPMKFSQQQGGHLRRLLWHAMDAQGLEPVSDRQMWHPDLYVVIDDWTTDIDDEADVGRLPMIGAHCAAEGA